MSDLRDRVPGQSLIAELLRQRDLGTIQASPRQGMIRLTSESRPWYWGVLGERIIAELLVSLPSDYLVLHSVPIGNGNTDIDHVVIGPSGVFTINTKYTNGKKVWVGG